MIKMVECPECGTNRVRVGTKMCGICEVVLRKEKQSEDTEAKLRAQIALLRKALTNLYQEATDPGNIVQHDGWSVSHPYMELPKETEQLCQQALSASEE